MHNQRPQWTHVLIQMQFTECDKNKNTINWKEDHRNIGSITGAYSKLQSTSRDCTSQLTTSQGIFTPTRPKSIQMNPGVFSLKVQLVAAGVDTHINPDANHTKWNLKCQKSECWVCYSVNITSSTGTKKYQKQKASWDEEEQTHHVSLAHLLQYRWCCSKIFNWRVTPNQNKPSQ